MYLILTDHDANLAGIHLVQTFLHSKVPVSFYNCTTKEEQPTIKTIAFSELWWQPTWWLVESDLQENGHSPYLVKRFTERLQDQQTDNLIFFVCIPMRLLESYLISHQ